MDVVVRLHGPTDQAPKLRHLRVLAHVQLDDVPRTPIQPSVEGEFRQHDGVVTILMFYRRRASPKHRYDIIEVDYGGGAAPHTAKRSKGSIVVSLVLALPLYLYVEPRGRNLEQKPPQSRFCQKGKSPTRTPGPNATILGVWPTRHGPRRLAQGQTPGSPAFGLLASAKLLLHRPKASWA